MVSDAEEGGECLIAGGGDWLMGLGKDPGEIVGKRPLVKFACLQ